VANIGDDVVVCAWVAGRQEALAFDPRNKSTGLVLTKNIQTRGSEPFQDTNLYVATANQRGSTSGHIQWQMGDYIRIWNQQPGYLNMIKGFGMNLATVGMGKINFWASDLDLIE
jgi:hypothetical protein